jgi:serine/threonine-protein kinase RsbT
MECVVRIASDADILTARRSGRSLAAALGFGPRDLALITTVISELSRNILDFAKEGEITVLEMAGKGKLGITVVGRDHGPGILDVSQALRDGFSTSGSLGMGLPGVRQVMDEFEIQSSPGRGTAVTARKWKS